MNLDQSNEAACAQLEALLPKLGLKDQDFAKGLIHSTRTKGGTVNRLEWIHKLIDRAQQPAPAQAPQAQVGDFAGVYALFSKAKENLQRPKIRLQLADGDPLVLALAGQQSKTPGILNVTDGRPFGANVWYGRVSPDGAWTQSKNGTPERKAEVQGLLTKLAAQPAKVAAEYGRLTGRCCFCDRPLKDEQSTAAGFGPTCGAHYGLSDVRKEAMPVLKTAAMLED